MSRTSRTVRPALRQRSHGRDHRVLVSLLAGLAAGGALRLALSGRGADGLWRARRLWAWRLRGARRDPRRGARAALLFWALVAGIVFGIAVTAASDAVGRAAVTVVTCPWVVIITGAAGGAIFLARRESALGRGTWGPQQAVIRTLWVVASLALLALLVSRFGDNIRTLLDVNRGCLGALGGV